MLEMIREYGAERLGTSGEGEEIRRLHAEHYVGLGEGAEGGLNGPEQRRILERLEADHDNIRAALRWAREKGRGTGLEAQEAVDIGLRIGGAIRHFWLLRSSYSEGREQLQRLLALSPQPTLSAHSKRVRAKGMAAVGRLAYRQGDYAAACSALEESLALRRDIGDKAGTAWSLTYLAMARLQQIMLSHAE
jgi:non-specific serine/threonine protein kinase